MSIPDDRPKWRDWIAEIEDNHGVTITEDERTALAEVLADIEAMEADNTLSNRKVALKQWLQHLDDTELTVFDAASKIKISNKFKNRLLNGSYAPRTVREKMYALSAIYGTLQKLDYVDSNPIEALDVKKLEQTRREKYSPREYITVEEYRELVSGADRLRDKIIVKLLFQTGVRVGEAVEITRNDIDFENRSIKIETIKQGEYAEEDTRNVYFRRNLRRDLREFYEDGHRLAYPPATDDYPEYLLVSKEQSPMQPQRISEIIHEIASQDSVELEHYDSEGMYTDASGATRHWLTAHLLRKSYAVHRVKNGMPIVFLTDTLGHADVETTKERYLDYRDEDIREADERYSPL